MTQLKLICRSLLLLLCSQWVVAEDVSIHLKWYHKFQFAGYYAAQQQGYFSDEGYNVTLIEGGPRINHLHHLINHTSQYAILGSEALNSLAVDSPVIIVASIFQHAPEVLMTLKSSEAKSIQDLKNKPLMLANGSISGQIEAMLVKNALNPEDYQKFNYDGDVTKLADGSVFAMYGYISNEPYQLLQLGLPVDLFRPRDYDIDFYGDNLATTQYELNNYPERVAAMRRAVIRGWNYALKHPDAIIAYILELPTNNPLPYNVSHQEYEAQVTADLIDMNNVPLGTTSPDRWASMFDTFNETTEGQAVFNAKSIYNEFHYDRRWINYVFIIIAFASFIIAAMYFWNRTLRNKLDAAITGLENAAFKDILTGMRNRSSMMLYIEKCRIKHRNNLYLVLIDIVALQKINKEQGFKKADSLIQSIAATLEECALKNSHNYSLYGGKFAIITTAERFQELERKINILLEKVAQANDSVELRAGAIKLDFSLDNSTLTTRAELTLQHAKETNSEKLASFNILILEKASRNEALMKEVIEGINKQEFVAYYQPKVNYSTGEIQGLEALMRWDHPEKGVLLPGTFLPVVENNPEIMMELEKSIFDTILSEANELIKYYQSNTGFRVSINLSSIQFNQSSLVHDLLLSCQRFSVDPKFIEFELTESSMLEDLDLAIDISNQLQEAGFHVALDDFGTGYSSLAYIQNLPVNVIKLDYSFVKKIPQDTRSGFVVEHIISLAHKLGLIVVAEGVEEIDQLHYLGNLDIDMIQGFYFYRPMPLNQACELDLKINNYK